MLENKMIEDIKKALADSVEGAAVQTSQTTSSDLNDGTPLEKMDGQTDIEVENEKGVYKSDNQEEDKWDNITQKCWTGYTQRGMKDKGGKQVPNCVPIEKVEDLSEAGQVSKSIWDGLFTKKISN